MIRLSVYPFDFDAVPHAIFWRPLRYFAMNTNQGEDGLDVFESASFTKGNSISFDLRKYRGHPDFTVTVYLPINVEDEIEVINTIKTIIEEMAVPKMAVAWMRGWDFKFGELNRPSKDRLTEAEARILALKIASRFPNRTASTEEIKKEIPSYIDLSLRDLVRSPTRRNEQRWQQIVGNVISHRDTFNGPFKKKYAIRTHDGLSVTDEGMDYLKSIGFST